MWKLRKPGTGRMADDIDRLVSHCALLGETDKPKLHALYRDYDRGGGEVTAAQLLPLAAKGTAIREQYKKTYKGQPLAYMRGEILAGVDRCPYCGINECSTLDHFMDKSTYGQLAVCRLNLVPMCGVCNTRKSDTPYSEFTHPYYARFPDTDFLRAVCSIRDGCVVVDWGIDASSVGDPQLLARLRSQLDRTGLRERLGGEAVSCLRDMFHGCRFASRQALRAFLSIELADKMGRYGRNHWRTALIRGMLGCADFTESVANEYGRSGTMENGVGA